MGIDFGSFLGALTSDPILALIVVLCVGATMVNGATDAPNAIATVVGTRAMRPTPAIVMAAGCNLVGLLGITAVSTAVASTIFKMVDFGGDNHAALVALAAAMVAIIVWGVAAWALGIPTSQSHSLIAGITGAAIALQGGLAGVNGAEWMKVIYGLALSIGLGFVMGWVLCKLVSILFAAANRRRANVFFKYAQIASAAAMSFMHGAQDGQKFIGVLFLGVAFANGQTGVGDAGIPIWIMLLCSATMGIGTSVGGERIIKSVGQSMVKLEKYQGFSADLAGAANLLLATLTGIPVSSTHIKTCAIMGVGAVKRLSAINFGVVKDMMFTWFFTFPACGLISFVMARLFMMFL